MGGSSGPLEGGSRWPGQGSKSSVIQGRGQTQWGCLGVSLNHLGQDQWGLELVQPPAVSSLSLRGPCCLQLGVSSWVIVWALLGECDGDNKASRASCVAEKLTNLN